jgi:WD40 repeat protein/mono/diheme cytochrome c family protein
MRPGPTSAAALSYALLLGGAARADLAGDARTVLERRCAACHGAAGTAKGGFDYVLDRGRLVARSQVVPGRAAESPLFRRVERGEMPPPGKGPLSAAEADLLRRWIGAGAPAAGAAPAAFVTDADIYRAVLADLQAMEPRRRRFARYLTLAHLANAGAGEADLRLHRQALSKLANSLSWHPRVTRPQPVDAGQTIFRLDLRDYRWEPRLWDRLAAASPYHAVEPGADGRALAALAGCERPVLRGDWFVAAASRPPFYHDFLGLPGTDRALERLLQVDVAAGLREDRAARAGFNGSGVARNNRLLERHDAPFGAYWRSYDFAGNSGRENLFEHPLGPSGVLTPDSGAFAHVGGEVIFSLPNGLQGYLLVDGQGRRLDKAPGEVVSDARRPDRLVENGLSCIGCHAGGLLPKDDQVRAHVLKETGAFSEADREAVRALYPPADRFRALLDEDAARFVRALERAGVTPGEPEPVLAVELRYEAVVDLPAAAAELGLRPDDFRDRLRRSPGLTRALGALLTRGGTVQRPLLEERFAELAQAVSPARVGPAGSAPPTAPFAGHRGAVHAAAFTPDGRTALSAGEDRCVCVWDAASGAERACWEGHADEVFAVAATPDGRRVLSGGRDRTLRLWDLDTGKELRRFAGHTDAVRCAAVAPDGRTALSGGDDRALRLWDLATGQELAAWAGHAGAVRAVAFSPDGRLALSGGADGTVLLWDVAAGRPRARWQGPARDVLAVAFSPDGRQALTGGADRAVRLWDVATGRELRRLSGHANTVVAVAFTPDGRRALSAASRYQTADRPVRVWDLASGKELAAAGDIGEGAVACAAFAPDGRAVLLGQPSGALRRAPLPEK